MRPLFFKAPSIAQNQLFKFKNNLLEVLDVFHHATVYSMPKLSQ